MNPFTALFQGGRDRRARRELLQLDDHLLRDIGLTRAEVQRMGTSGFDRKNSRSTK